MNNTLLAAIFLGFTAIEMTAIAAESMKNHGHELTPGQKMESDYRLMFSTFLESDDFQALITKQKSEQEKKVSDQH